jgi:hypothetical protein
LPECRLSDQTTDLIICHDKIIEHFFEIALTADDQLRVLADISAGLLLDLAAVDGEIPRHIPHAVHAGLVGKEIDTGQYIYKTCKCEMRNDLLECCSLLLKEPAHASVDLRVDCVVVIKWVEAGFLHGREPHVP